MFSFHYFVAELFYYSFQSGLFPSVHREAKRDTVFLMDYGKYAASMLIDHGTLSLYFFFCSFLFINNNSSAFHKIESKYTFSFGIITSWNICCRVSYFLSLPVSFPVTSCADFSINNNSTINTNNTVNTRQQKDKRNTNN